MHQNSPAPFRDPTNSFQPWIWVSWAGLFPRCLQVMSQGAVGMWHGRAGTWPGACPEERDNLPSIQQGTSGTSTPSRASRTHLTPASRSGCSPPAPTTVPCVPPGGPERDLPARGWQDGNVAARPWVSHHINQAPEPSYLTHSSPSSCQ